MNPICVAGHLEGEENVENTDRVKIIKHLRFHLYLKGYHHLGNSACQAVIEILGPFGQAITAVGQGTPVVCFDQLEDDYRLF